MSEENVEIVRAFLDAMNRGDTDATLKDTAPGFEFDFSRSIGMSRGVYGPEELRRFADQFAEMWESSRWEADEFIEIGEHVVSPLIGYHVGREGIEVQTRTAWMWTFRDGQIARITFFQERAEALEAAGVSE